MVEVIVIKIYTKKEEFANKVLTYLIGKSVYKLRPKRVLGAPRLREKKVAIIADIEHTQKSNKCFTAKAL